MRRSDCGSTNVERDVVLQDRALESLQQETRRYAKRQLTWFRKEPGVHWIRGFGDDVKVHAEALAILQRAGSTQSQNIHKSSAERK